MEPLGIESCHSTWLFDEDRMQFRRTLKDIVVDGRPVVTQWRDYYGLDLDPQSESFVVLLNPEGTRLIRSWRHGEDCPDCNHATAELSLDQVRSAI